MVVGMRRWMEVRKDEMGKSALGSHRLGVSSTNQEPNYSINTHQAAMSFKLQVNSSHSGSLPPGLPN